MELTGLQSRLEVAQARKEEREYLRERSEALIAECLRLRAKSRHLLEKSEDIKSTHSPKPSPHIFLQG